MGDVVKSKPYLTELKIIEQTQGYVMHGMRSSDGSCAGFGEAYFSTVNNGMIKGWKLHRKMTLNLIVPHGEIRFVVHGASEDSLGGEEVPLLSEASTACALRPFICRRNTSSPVNSERFSWTRAGFRKHFAADCRRPL